MARDSQGTSTCGVGVPGGLGVKGDSTSFDTVGLALDRSHTISYWPSMFLVLFGVRKLDSLG